MSLRIELPQLGQTSQGGCCGSQSSHQTHDGSSTTGLPASLNARSNKRWRVLLINPPRFSELIGKNPAIVEKHRGFNPPLGILSLAGYLEEHTSCLVNVFDAQPRGYTY